MKKPLFNRTHLLFTIIFLEGYVVLAVELLSIRLLIPFVGSGTEVVSIIISSVLLPLAFGYQYGGNYIARQRKGEIKKGKNRKPISVRKILVKNLFSSLCILMIGLSYVIQEILFGIMDKIGLHSVVLQTTIFCLLFIAYPTFLLAQTVPLASNYFAKRKLSHMTGWMLCFSTSGSFLGSVFTTIVLMMSIGVHNTVILVMCCIGFMLILLDKKNDHFSHFFVAFLLVLTYMMNSSDNMSNFKVVSNNAYNIVQIFDANDNKKLDKDSKIFSVNRSSSSLYNPDKEKNFAYIKHIEHRVIEPIQGQNKKILIIGAGGFTLGFEDKTNDYTYVDIDPDLKEVAEKYFLPHPLESNKKFVPMSARAYLAKNQDKFDFIFVDAFTNLISIPMECTTREFFQSVKEHLNKNGIVAMNVISRPDMRDKFSLRMNNTFSSVFPAYSREIIYPYNAWTSEIMDLDIKNDKKIEHDNKKSYYTNVIYIYYNHDGINDNTVYTDDKNTYAIDKKIY